MSKVHYHCFCDTKYPPPWDWRTNDNKSVQFSVGVPISDFIGKKLDKERNSR